MKDKWILSPQMTWESISSHLWDFLKRDVVMLGYDDITIEHYTSGLDYKQRWRVVPFDRNSFDG